MERAIVCGLKIKGSFRYSFFFFSSRRRHTRYWRDWSSNVCSSDLGPLHVVSAWASGQGPALGQRAVDGTSNEITAVPELLETLHLEGCIVTLDAMGCQKDIAAQIRAKGADYLMVLKANHGRAFGALREQFERTGFGRGCKRRPVFDAFDEGHEIGRAHV